jgi:hypothetical protein
MTSTVDSVKHVSVKQTKRPFICIAIKIDLQV